MSDSLVKKKKFIGEKTSKSTKQKYQTRWCSKSVGGQLNVLGWVQTSDWRWSKNDYSVSIYHDDEGWWNVDVWHNQWSINVDVTRKKSAATKTALRLMLENKVEEYFGSSIGYEGL
jgi:hypothetical protein